MNLSGVGVWSSQLRYGNPGEAAASAADLEELGFEALWVPDVGGSVMDSVARLLASTEKVAIATGIRPPSVIRWAAPGSAHEYWPPLPPRP